MVCQGLVRLCIIILDFIPDIQFVFQKRGSYRNMDNDKPLAYHNPYGTLVIEIKLRQEVYNLVGGISLVQGLDQPLLAYEYP